jgi:hypothetical protein
MKTREKRKGARSLGAAQVYKGQGQEKAAGVKTGVMTREKKWIWAGILLVGQASLWWCFHPVGLHKTVQVGGVTASVPFGWLVKEGNIQRSARVAILKTAVPLRPWMSASVWTQGSNATLESARWQQTAQAFSYAHSTVYSDPKTFEVTSGRYSSLCAEGTTRSDGRAATCFVVGTPLWFDFYSSSHAGDDDLRRMLGSLR